MDSQIFQALIHKMETMLLGLEAGTEVSIGDAFSSAAYFSICMGAALAISGWRLLEDSLLRSMDHSGQPKLGLLGMLGIIMLVLFLPPLVSTTTWSAAFGNPFQQLALAALHTPAIPLANTAAHIDIIARLALEDAAIAMVRDLAFQSLAFHSLLSLIGLHILHSSFIRPNFIVPSRSPMFIGVAFILLLFGLPGLASEASWDAMAGDPRLFLTPYIDNLY